MNLIQPIAKVHPPCLSLAIDSFHALLVRFHFSETIVQRSLWTAKSQCKVSERCVFLLSLLEGTPDCFLSVACRTVCWRHTEFGCSSVGGE